MRRRTRETTPRELALWRHMVRDVQPLSGSDGSSPPEESSPAAASAPPAPKPPPAGVARPTKARPPPEPSPTNLDRRTWQRLQRGLYPVSARLDLHGLTQADAYARLVDFVRAQHAKGTRCVLVITGRGLRSGGILKNETPRWLASPPIAGLVLAHTPASLAHGGDGAIYLLLRRKREG